MLGGNGAASIAQVQCIAKQNQNTSNPDDHRKKP
jgi:hypothetical protein